MNLDDLGAAEPGATVLADVEAFLGRFVAFPTEHARVAATLWAGHAHLLDAFESTPRIAFLSPEPGSGKSRTLEVLGTLVPAPMHAVNATPAALFRAVSDLEHRPTILFDEIDTVFGPKAKENEEVRGFLNAGHRRGAVAYRCVGEGTRQKVTPFPAFCAVAVAGLNDLPDTIATRAVLVRMRRRAPHERVEPFRFRRHDPEGYALRARLSAWAAVIAAEVDGAEPAMPDGVEDRPADVWEPLLVVADAAGGDWPERGRAACAHFVGAARTAEPSLGVRLLADLRDLWADLGDPIAAHTDVLLDRLHKLEDAPWADLRGRPLDGRRLAHYLRRYDVTSTSVKVDARSAKGYRRDELHDAWTRYLVSPAGQGSPRSPASPREGNAPDPVTQVTLDNPGPTPKVTPIHEGSDPGDLGDPSAGGDPGADPWAVTEDDGSIGAAAWMTAALDDLDPAVGE